MLLQQIINGFTIGATYALVAVGFSMVYGVLELVNFANGAFYVLGPYVVLIFTVSLGVSFPVAFLLAILGTGILGACMDRFILTPIRNSNAPKRSSMVASLGVATVITNTIMTVFGSETKYFPDVFGLGKVYIGSAIITGNQIVIAVTAVVIMIVLSITVYRTTLGSAMRSIAQNPRAAMIMGVDVNRTITITFFIGTMSAAIAGTMVAIYYGSIDTTLYLGVNIKTFASAVLGGVGSIPGAMVGGLIIGFLETFVSGYISSAYQDSIAFMVLVVILIFRPSGLFGQKQITKV